MKLFVTLNPAKGYAGKQLKSCMQVMEIWPKVITVKCSKDGCMTKPHDYFVLANPSNFDEENIHRVDFPIEYHGSDKREAGAKENSL